MERGFSPHSTSTILSLGFNFFGAVIVVCENLSDWYLFVPEKGGGVNVVPGQAWPTDLCYTGRTLLLAFHQGHSYLDVLSIYKEDSASYDP